MTSLFEIEGTHVRLLDAGAGTGVLSAAFCQRLLGLDRKAHLTIHAYENDAELQPYLRAVLAECERESDNKGHRLEYSIVQEDFVLHNQHYARQPDMFSARGTRVSYDYVISNPPYYKVGKDCRQAAALREFVYGQPNIYALFMALAVSMTRPDGQLVFITPRSFCSGLYYREFRKWFLANVQITNIHLFESRKDIFETDGILQENVILRVRARRGKADKQRVVVTAAKDRYLRALTTLEADATDVICADDREAFIRIPTSTIDVEVLRMVDTWPNTLGDFGVEVSTGPVVPFRAVQHLLPRPTEAAESAPLLWMHNLQDMRAIWPLRKNKKPSAIRVCADTMALVLPVKNYVLVKRFSSKEQKRRLSAAVLLQSEFDYRHVAIENHVNYIHRPGGDLSVDETLGIAAILNTTLVDNYFRSLNGNTQVNATDLRSLPFPDLEHLVEIGRMIRTQQPSLQHEGLDHLIARVLGIDDATEQTICRRRSAIGQD